jgi:hypothetical protein
VIAGKKKNPFARKGAADVTEGGQLNASAKVSRRKKPDGWHYVAPPEHSRSRRGKGGVTKEQLFLQVWAAALLPYSATRIGYLTTPFGNKQLLGRP